MTAQDKLPLHHPAALIGTWFGAGRLPMMPGTWGSVAALPFAWGFHSVWGAKGLLIAAAVVFAAGLWASWVMARNLGEPDPGEIVVDEVVGMWITLAFVPPSFMLYAIGFALFRVFDIFKPWPVSWAERELAGALGVMADDVVAGGYALAGITILMAFGVGGGA